jgi:hypothetical protein
VRGLPAPNDIGALYFLRLECRAARFKCRLRRRLASTAGPIVWPEPFSLSCADRSALTVALWRCAPEPIADAVAAAATAPVLIGEVKLVLCLPPGSQDATAQAWHALRPPADGPGVAPGIDVGFRMRIRLAALGDDDAPARTDPPQRPPVSPAPGQERPAEPEARPPAPGGPDSDGGDGPRAEGGAAHSDAENSDDGGGRPDYKRGARRALAAAERAAGQGAAGARQEEARLARRARRLAGALGRAVDQLERARAGAEAAEGLAAAAARLRRGADADWQRASAPAGRALDRAPPAPLTWRTGGWGGEGGQSAVGRGVGRGDGSPARGPPHRFDRH